MWHCSGCQKLTHSFTLTDEQYCLMLSCIYGRIKEIEKQMERILDKRDALGYYNRLKQLNELKETMITGGDKDDGKE